MYSRLLAIKVIMERSFGPKKPNKTFISHVDISTELDDPQERQFYKLLLADVPIVPLPNYGLNWPTLVDRMRRIYEQIYNIIICKIPVHWIRLSWLRLGGAKIGKGSTIWRNTEVLGVENLHIGDDSVVAWHCLLDARAGLFIGDHVTVASYVLLIVGQHDLASSSFEGLAYPLYIGDYAWIASRALITGGARIGKGAVIGGATVINKTVADYNIMVGPTGKSIGERSHDLNYHVGGKCLFTLLH